MYRYIPSLLLTPIYIILGFYSYWAFDSHFIPTAVNYGLYIEDGTHEYRNGVIYLQRGETIKVSFDIERYKSCKVYANRSAHNISTNTEYLLSYAVSIVTPEPRHKVTRYIVIPDNLPSGDYKLEVKLTYECNPLETIFPKSIIPDPIPFIIR